MRRILTIGLLFVILFPLFTKVWVVADFKINQAYIAKNLCVKKEVVNNSCQGKCHLKKQLKITEGREKENEQLPYDLLKKINENNFFSELKKFHPVFSLLVEADRFLPNYQNTFSEQHLFSVFHPPKV